MKRVKCLFVKASSTYDFESCNDADSKIPLFESDFFAGIPPNVKSIFEPKYLRATHEVSCRTIRFLCRQSPVVAYLIHSPLGMCKRTRKGRKKSRRIIWVNFHRVQTTLQE